MADNNIIIRDPSSASAKEVARIVAELIKSIKTVKSSLSEDIAGNASAISKLEKSVNISIKELQKEIGNSTKETKDKAYKDLNAEVYKLEKLISEVPQFSPVQLEQKFGAVIKDLEQRFHDKVNSIEIPTLPSPEATRDLLESLEGNEKLNWSAVDGVVGIHVGKTPPEDNKMLWIDTR